MSQSYSNKAKKKTKFRIAFDKFSDKTSKTPKERGKVRQLNSAYLDGIVSQNNTCKYLFQCCN